MFSYWAKKPNKTTERNSIEHIEGEEPNQRIEGALGPPSDERLLEFQDFLRRVQTLQMSPTNLPSSSNNYQFPAVIEVGVEPTMLMELDKKYPISREGSIINKKTNSANIRVNVGIDKDLEMILEMDPSIVDLGDIAVGETTEPRVVGLPPLSGG